MNFRKFRIQGLGFRVCINLFRPSRVIKIIDRLVERAYKKNHGKIIGGEFNREIRV